MSSILLTLGDPRQGFAVLIRQARFLLMAVTLLPFAGWT